MMCWVFFFIAVVLLVALGKYLENRERRLKEYSRPQWLQEEYKKPIGHSLEER